MDLRQIGCEDGRWMELAQDRVQSWVISGTELSGSATRELINQ